jgi:hypothetical protein
VVIETEELNLLNFFPDSNLKSLHCTTETEIAVFYKSNTCSEEVIVNRHLIKTKNVIKVLGVMTDTTLSWHEHVTTAVAKCYQKYM